MSEAMLIKYLLDYNPVTGRLMRKKRKTSGRLGVPIGYTEKQGHRRVHIANKSRMTSHLVWAWHHGEFPNEQLAHLNEDIADDRIENLALRSSLRRKVLAVEPGTIDATNMLGDIQGVFNTGIYEILNIKNGHRYIGSAVNVSKRWRDHLRELERGIHHSKYLQRSFAKHGEQSFVFKVLLACSKENLLHYEQSLIDFYKPEFNSRPTAGSQFGFRHSAASRKRMSESRPKDFSPMKGRKHTEEAKAKVSATKTGVKFGAYSPDRIAKTAKAMREGKGALTEDQVRVIRRMKLDGHKHQAVADVVGCSYWAVADIAQSKTYKWLI
jgi:group I intron endonuclease